MRKQGEKRWLVWLKKKIKKILLTDNFSDVDEMGVVFFFLAFQFNSWRIFFRGKFFVFLFFHFFK